MNMNEIVDRLFIKLEGRFSTKPPFTRGQDVIDIVKETWAEEFTRKKITVEQMKKGLDRLVDEGIKFFPDIGEFLQFCEPTPEELGLPSSHDAYKEACNNAHKQSSLKWTHEAVRQAAIRITLHRLKHEARIYTQNEFKEHYLEIVNSISQGNELPSPTQAFGINKKPRSGLECPATTKYAKQLAEAKNRAPEGPPEETLGFWLNKCKGTV